MAPFEDAHSAKNDKSGEADQAISTQYLVAEISKTTIFSVFSCFSGDSAGSGDRCKNHLFFTLADFFAAAFFAAGRLAVFAAFRGIDSAFDSETDLEGDEAASSAAKRAATASWRVRSASNSSRVTKPRAFRLLSRRWRIILSISSRTPPRADAAPFAI